MLAIGIWVLRKYRGKNIYWNKFAIYLLHVYLCFIIQSWGQQVKHGTDYMNTSTTYGVSPTRQRRAMKTQSPVLISRQKLTAKMMVEEPAVEFAARKVTCSRDIYSIAERFIDWDDINVIESAHAIYLNRANVPVAWALLSTGGMSATIVDAKVVFSHALLCQADSIILLHNHPSGQLTPSQPDKDLTRTMVEGAKLLGMRVLDHLILTPSGAYLSFADEGLMPY